ncbi:hypothetical protein QBC46DRAFT_376216 [Diplogelasinospora grovesii]|uniref:non-specific serine/threonine protein kinase n=1 Tax=Diplogelasinospora grovesii TaxID=303347 RepID=A0AAN6NHI4_9PEZI|nr:hypothetical protein QBC46DRAFT_376216 [Diplogelasinospora grovesii]
MALQSEIIEGNPIGNGLDFFRASFNSMCQKKDIPCPPDACSLDALGKLSDDDLQNLTLDLLAALQGLHVSRLLPSSSRGKNLLGDLVRLISAVNSNDFDFDRIRPLLTTVLDRKPDNEIWDQVYDVVTESTPPPRPIASSVLQTPPRRNTSSLPNSSEYRKHVNNLLKEELGPMYTGLSDFHERFFGRVAGLKAASEAVFAQCQQGSYPLYAEGAWREWPANANQDLVLGWFANVSDKLADWAAREPAAPTYRRRPLTQPNKPIDGSKAPRKMDVGFMRDPEVNTGSRHRWSQILVPGELKSNPAADKSGETKYDLGRYVREVFAAQESRRFVLGFTLCGAFMRVWEFDRLGGIASLKFNINEDGLQFVSTILGFLWMNEEELGFDPTIIAEDGRQVVKIERNGQTDRLVIDGRMRRDPCIAGRATICWKAHLEKNPQTPLVIKDSWQYTERAEEGEMLREATDKGVVNVARYYHHETVQVVGTDDDVQKNVRKGLDVTTAENYKPGSLMSRSISVINASWKGRNSMASRKRSPSPTDAPLPPSKRSCSGSSTRASSNLLPNRVHRRVVLCDYGEPIYKASSRSALLAALEGCIEGHESLLKAGFLHRDVSINNLMINEDNSNPSWPSFLIDLDLAIKVQRDGASGAMGKTGTRAFMAIGALLGEQHSFMHDLESFFWVLFWICIHYDGPGNEREVTQFDNWNYVDMKELAKLKLGTVSNEVIFQDTTREFFTEYYSPFTPWVNMLRRVVFPNNGKWERENMALYSQMREILQEARRAFHTEP